MIGLNDVKMLSDTSDKSRQCASDFHRQSWHSGDTNHVERHVKFEADSDEQTVLSGDRISTNTPALSGILKTADSLPDSTMENDDSLDSPLFTHKYKKNTSSAPSRTIRNHHFKQLPRVVNGTSHLKSTNSDFISFNTPRNSLASNSSSCIILPAVTKPYTHQKPWMGSRFTVFNPNLGGWQDTRGQRKTTSESNRRQSVIASMVEHMSRKKESCEQKLCQIYVLLTFLQVALGLSISGMGIYLPFVSSSITFAEATVWSGVLLFIAGISSAIYYTNYIKQPQVRGDTFKAKLLKISSSVMFCISGVVCFAASILSGTKGGVISSYHYPCQYREEEGDCLCLTKNETLVEMKIDICPSQYSCCEVLFTNIKDCLLLECAFNFVGVITSIWLIVIVWRQKSAIFTDHRRPSLQQIRRESMFSYHK